jgi:hypothetical protein
MRCLLLLLLVCLSSALLQRVWSVSRRELRQMQPAALLVGSQLPLLFFDSSSSCAAHVMPLLCVLLFFSLQTKPAFRRRVVPPTSCAV